MAGFLTNKRLLDIYGWVLGLFGTKPAAWETVVSNFRESYSSKMKELEAKVPVDARACYDGQFRSDELTRAAYNVIKAHLVNIGKTGYITLEESCDAVGFLPTLTKMVEEYEATIFGYYYEVEDTYAQHCVMYVSGVTVDRFLNDNRDITHKDNLNEAKASFNQYIAEKQKNRRETVIRWVIGTASGFVGFAIKAGWDFLTVHKSQ